VLLSCMRPTGDAATSALEFELSCREHVHQQGAKNHCSGMGDVESAEDSSADDKRVGECVE
jgi:hypothetical protein